MLRELNELEFLSLAVGQPFNVAVMLKFKGKISEYSLTEAMGKLQIRHPLLKVRLTKDDKGRPWFTTEKVGKIPIREVLRKNDSQALDEFHRQLSTPFDLDCIDLPLIRVTLYSSAEKSEIVICSLHTISDGFSMVWLVRDLLKYLINPNESIVKLDFPTKDVDLFTPKVRRMIPKTAIFAHIVYAALRSYNFLRYLFSSKRKTAKINVTEDSLDVYSTKLSKEQTAIFLEKCRTEQVTVHSAVSTAFIQERPIIGSPVNLRNRLNHNIKDEFGFYSGVAVYKTKYRKKLSFWDNARRAQKQLRKSLRDRKLFVLQKIFSKTVSVEHLRKIGTYYVELVTKKEPFSIDNLGRIDDHLKGIDLGKLPFIESFYGGISSFLDTFIVLFYTLREEMHFFFHYTNTKYLPEEIKSYAKTILKRLGDSLEN